MELFVCGRFHLPERGSGSRYGRQEAKDDQSEEGESSHMGSILVEINRTGKTPEWTTSGNPR